MLDSFAALSWLRDNLFLGVLQISALRLFRFIFALVLRAKAEHRNRGCLLPIMVSIGKPIGSASAAPHILARISRARFCVGCVQAACATN